jgi:hypothetical protein
VHVRNRNIVGESDLTYIITDDKLLSYQLEIEEKLLNVEYLKKSLKRCCIYMYYPALQTCLVQAIYYSVEYQSLLIMVCTI